MRQFERASGRSLAMQLGLGVLAILASSTSLAEPASEAYRMMVISNKALGDVLLAGDYDKTIQKLGGTHRLTFRFSLSNNLCVAYVNAKKPDEAKPACDRAVRRSRTMTRHDQAIALSNRGVVRALIGDIDGARRDFRSAIRLEKELDAPSENLAKLQIKLGEAVSSS